MKKTRGTTGFPLKRNGNTLRGPVVKPRMPGEIRSTAAVPCTATAARAAASVGVIIFQRASITKCRHRSKAIPQTNGACTICMAMSGNGARTFSRVTRVVLRLIRVLSKGPCGYVEAEAGSSTAIHAARPTGRMDIRPVDFHTPGSGWYVKHRPHRPLQNQ